MNALTETQKAYLAGLIDGEGCITIIGHNGSGAASVIINMTAKDLIYYWHGVTGLGSIYENKHENKPNWRPTYQWQIRSRQACDFLKEIYDYLILKKDQADIVFEFMALVREPGCNYVSKEVAQKRNFLKKEVARLKHV
jgi:hypothetical protein